MLGGAGDDGLQGYLGDDTLIGGAGSDVLFGGAGADVLDGHDDDNGMDFLNGGAGDDALYAGDGDHMHGGTGADLFGLRSDGHAHVADFDPDEDTIEIAYDSDLDAPTVGFEDTDEGVILIADGHAIATFAGHTALDLANVPLVLLPA